MNFTVFGRIMSNVQAKKAIYEVVKSSGLAFPGMPEKPTMLFLGESEWIELLLFCEEWGVPIAGADPNYNPTLVPSVRSEVSGCAVYRVDAESFLLVV